MTRTQRKRKADVVHRIGDWKFWSLCAATMVASCVLIVVSVCYLSIV